MDKDKLLLTRLSTLLNITLLLTIGIFIALAAVHFGAFTFSNPTSADAIIKEVITPYWHPPSLNEIPSNEEGDLIRYGRELIMHTSVYLGPKGTVKPSSNGMNCRNCHLDGGTKTFGYNYSAVAATYPQLRKRSNTIIDVKERINECIERSLNGTRLQQGDIELDAMAAYILWLGKDVPKGQIPEGAGMKTLVLLDRPADPVKGKIVFDQHCVECHGANSEGEMESNGLEWKYPPVFGNHSYNVGAGLYRLEKFASFVKYNMPFGISYESPVLTDEEAWDVAAYVNSMPHPAKDISADWPDITLKPFDHPFGPFADNWSEERHKYGPFIK
ncbi:MAG TPA: cytochrome C [Cytophagales bacterium]|nr:cytochrome C [Cytophagales bacterium]